MVQVPYLLCCYMKYLYLIFAHNSVVCILKIRIIPASVEHLSALQFTQLIYCFIFLQQMERILKKASKTHKLRVEVSREFRCLKSHIHL